ncbi:MAG: hypothetical protein NVS9B1_12210 [Candidatus Dormibacteraceae bacterium]
MPRLRARRSRYRFTNRLAGSAPAAIVVAVLIIAIGLTSLVAARVVGFLNHVTGTNSSFSTLATVTGISDYAPGTIGYRLKHKDPNPINILMLGYGGAENDAPFLTDTLMVIRLDPVSNRVAMISVPRDLYVSIDAWPATSTIRDKEKINAAFEFGTDESQAIDNAQKRPEYRGRDGGGHLAEDTVGKVTGLHFDKYAGMDFKAFRDVVNALGGVDVCLDTPLDDNLYPDYHDGYIRGGIHYKAGCQHVDGEQALQLARSREAIEPEQASDFGRARRQQQIIASIKKQALSVNGVTKAPQLMGALDKNFKTDMSVEDLNAIYGWSKKVDDRNILHFALTNENLLQVGGCGPPSAGYILCPDDPSYSMIRTWVKTTFPPAPVLAGHAPVQVAWGGNPTYLADGVTNLIKPYGFVVADPLHTRTTPAQTVIYDFSGGQYPDTSEFLASFFGGAQVVQITQSTPAPTYIPSNQGFVVYVGHDFGRRWYNCASTRGC